MPDNTLFPGLDGTPGDLPESTDITDTLLPRLDSDPTPAPDGEDYPISSSAADVTVLPNVPNGGDYDYAPPRQNDDNEVAIVDGAPRQAPSQAPRRSLDDRIARLHGSNANRGRNYAEDQLAQLTEALLNQGRQIEQLIGERRAPAPRSTQEVDPISGQAADAPAPSVSAGDIENIVTRAIQNYDANLASQRQAASELQLAQEDAFLQAQADVPGLDDPNSQVHKTFMKVWSRSPLRQLPDGPLHVAFQVQGLLAQEAAANAQLTNRKRQAGVSAPAPSATDVLDGSKTQALQQEYARISNAIKAGSKDPDLMLKFRKLGRVLGRTRIRKTN